MQTTIAHRKGTFFSAVTNRRLGWSSGPSCGTNTASGCKKKKTSVKMVRVRIGGGMGDKASNEGVCCVICLEVKQHEPCASSMCTRIGALRCGRCKAVWYCSKECQTTAWHGGHRRACVQSNGSQSPPTRVESTPLPMGCACRSDSGVAHLACMTALAVSQQPLRGEEAWCKCKTCGLHFTGAMQLALARAWVARTAGRPLLDDERIAACSNLSTALTDTVQYDEAMATLQRMQAVLDRDDPRWIRCMSKVARILIHTGLYDQAEAICRPLLAGLADDDADCETCILRSYLAVAMMHQRQHAEAEDILRRVLEALTRTRGPEHHETLSVADYLAQCLYFQESREKKAQAANLQRELLRVQALVRGPDHPATLNTLNNLGCSLFELGEFEDAARVVEEAYAKRRHVLGAEHPHTLSTMTILAPILVEVGQPVRAVEVLRACLDARRRLLGPEHVDTLATSMELQDIVAATRRARRSARGLDPNKRVSHAQATSTTTHCHAPRCRSEGVMRMCGRCGRVGYCSRECQVADWRAHKPDCSREP